MAEVHAILANGGVAEGRRFMSEAGCRRALQPQVEGTDLILGVPIRFGLGFALDPGLMPHPNTLYWGGYGGSLAIIDMDARSTIAYAMNKMSGTTTGDFRAPGLGDGFLGGVDGPEPNPRGRSGRAPGVLASQGLPLPVVAGFARPADCLVRGANRSQDEGCAAVGKTFLPTPSSAMSS